MLRLLDDRLLYLDRYWREEEQVCADLLSRPAPVPLSPEETARLETALDRVFQLEGYDEQRAAARVALSQGTTVLTGGPGTGKTTTVAALLALLAEQAQHAGGGRPRIALAAPTGKAAARLQQAVEDEVRGLPESDQIRLGPLKAVTLHRLLGPRPDTSARFRHHRENRLPHDVVVVDETSMVSLTMMARLLEAVRPESRLLLVGDPDQLASVEAGAVLADLVEGLGGRDDQRIAALRTSHRFGESIRLLAEAVRAGDADEAVALLQAGGEHIEFVSDAEPTARLRSVLVPRAVELVRAAERGDADAALAALDRQRLLCAHREGPHGVRHWNRQVERWLTEETGEPIWSSSYAGRPLLVTANDYGLGVHNGDTGVVVRRADGVLRAHVAGSTRRARPGDQPAGPGRDHARDDDPQEPGQPGRRGGRAAAAPGLAAADPRALLHRDHARPAQGGRGREPRRRAGRGRPPGDAGDRPPAAPDGTRAQCLSTETGPQRGADRVKGPDPGAALMPFLLRVELPDVPGSLGRVASAIGEAGGDIEAIEIVEKRHDANTAVDDILLEIVPGALPDSIVSACNRMDGVRVVWISRYAAGGNLFLDLEAVEEMTGDPAGALDKLVDLLPITFRADWAARMNQSSGIVHATEATPSDLEYRPIGRPARLDTGDDNVHCGAKLNKQEIVLIGRRGGPEFLDSELARLGHLVSLGASIARRH